MGRRALRWNKKYDVVYIPADGDCSMYTVFFHALVGGGMDARSAQTVLSLKGASPAAREKLDGLVALCRQRVVEYARMTGQKFYPDDGPVRTDEDLRELLRFGKIKSHGEWEFVHLNINGFFDEEGVRLAGELFELLDTRVVMEGRTGKRLVDVNAVELPNSGPPKSNIVLHRRHHFAPLVPMVKSCSRDRHRGKCFVKAEESGVVDHTLIPTLMMCFPARLLLVFSPGGNEQAL